MVSCIAIGLYERACVYYSNSHMFHDIVAARVSVLVLILVYQVHSDFALLTQIAHAVLLAPTGDHGAAGHQVTAQR